MLPERFERKYYLIPAEVGFAYGLLRQICVMDSRYPSEQINSLYFDTADLDQHARSLSGDFQKDKVRIRWYSQGEKLSGTQTLFTELKSKRGFASTKQRLKLHVSAERLAPENLEKGITPRTVLTETLARFGYYDRTTGVA
jgi:hypothetical protein